MTGMALILFGYIGKHFARKVHYVPSFESRTLPLKQMAFQCNRNIMQAILYITIEVTTCLLLL